MNLNIKDNGITPFGIVLLSLWLTDENVQSNIKNTKYTADLEEVLLYCNLWNTRNQNSRNFGTNDI